MFDRILNRVKAQVKGNPEVAPEKADIVKPEGATHINEDIENGAASEGGVEDSLSSLTGSLASGNPASGGFWWLNNQFEQ